MFNDYNETPLISCNEFNQDAEKKEENVPKWSYGAGMQPPPGYNRQSEYWPAKPNFLGLAPPVHFQAKYNCCYPSENSSYQGDSTRHRPWLPRFSIPLNGVGESSKLPGNPQWESMGHSNQEPCVLENNVLPPQYFQGSGGKHPGFHRQYQNAKLTEHHQTGVITSVKCSPENPLLLKQKDDTSTNSSVQNMPFYGQGVTRQSAFCNPAYDLSRNADKRLDDRSCDVSYCDLNDKYSSSDSYRHMNGVPSYATDQHLSKSPVLEPYMKSVPLNLNQNRVPSFGHRNLKENIPKTCIDPAMNRCNGGPRKMLGTELCQTINNEKNGRAFFQSSAAKDATAMDNYVSPGIGGVDLKNSEFFVDYSHFNVSRELPKHYDNLTEAEMQKKIRDKQVEYYSRNKLNDVIKRFGPSSLQTNKKDAALSQMCQGNFADQQQYGSSVSRYTQGGVHKYVEISNPKPSVAVFYPKDFGGLDKMQKSESCDRMQENLSLMRRTENLLKNENLSVHARLTRPPLIFNDPKDLRFIDRVQNSFPFQNNSTTPANFIPAEYPYQGYNVTSRFEYPHPFSANGFQRTDSGQFNHKSGGQRIPGCPATNQSFIPPASNAFAFDPCCQQLGNPDKTFPQQFYAGAEQVPSSLADMYSPAAQKSRLDNMTELQKQYVYIETVRGQELNKKAGNKISPLRLLRKKKSGNQKNDEISKSPVPVENSEKAPALDVRKFWSTWADEEEENSAPAQMVVLDCQNIDPEQAKLLQIYDSEHAVRDLNLENGSAVALKDCQSQKDFVNPTNGFDLDHRGTRENCGKFETADVIRKNGSEVPEEGNANCVDRHLERQELRKLIDGNVLTTSANSIYHGQHEVTTDKAKTQFAEQKSPSTEDTTLAEANGEPRHESIDFIMSNDFNETIADRIGVDQKYESSQPNKGIDEFRKDQGNESAHVPGLSFSPGEITPKTKCDGENACETPANGHVDRNRYKSNGNVSHSKSKCDGGKNGERYVGFALDGPSSQKSEKRTENNNSPSSDAENYTDLPTSEYRRNKFLDYCYGEIIAKETDGNNEDREQVSERAKENVVAGEKSDDSNGKKVKEENARVGLLSENNTADPKEELSKNPCHRSAGDFKPDEETGLQHYKICDILQKLSKINLHSPDVKVESVGINESRNEIETEKVKTAVALAVIKRKKSDEKSQMENDKRDDQLNVNDATPRSKSPIKISIEKSHYLKMSFRVHNSYSRSSSSGDKCCDNSERKNNREESENDGKMSSDQDPSDEVAKPAISDQSAFDKKHHRSQKGNYRKTKNKTKPRREAAANESDSPKMKAPVLKIKKSRYLTTEEKKLVEPEMNYETWLSVPGNLSDDFQVRESVNSDKIKLTFKRQRGSSESEYKRRDEEKEDATSSAIRQSNAEKSLSPKSESPTRKFTDFSCHDREPARGEEPDAEDTQTNDRDNKDDKSNVVVGPSVSGRSPDFHDTKQMLTSPEYSAEEKCVLELDEHKTEENDNSKETSSLSEKVQFRIEEKAEAADPGTGDVGKNEELLEIAENSGGIALEETNFMKSNKEGRDDVKVIANEFVNCDDETCEKDRLQTNDSDSLIEEDVVDLEKFGTEDINPTDPLTVDSPTTALEKITDAKFSSPVANPPEDISPPNKTNSQGKTGEEDSSPPKDDETLEGMENKKVESNENAELIDNETETEDVGAVAKNLVSIDEKNGDGDVYLSTWPSGGTKESSGCDDSSKSAAFDKNAEFDRRERSDSPSCSGQIEDGDRVKAFVENTTKTDESALDGKKVQSSDSNETSPEVVNHEVDNYTSGDNSLFDSLSMEDKMSNEGIAGAKRSSNSFNEESNLNEDKYKEFGLDLNGNRKLNGDNCEMNIDDTSSDEPEEVDEISQALEAIFNENVEDKKKEKTTKIPARHDPIKKKIVSENKGILTRRSTLSVGPPGDCEVFDEGVKSMPHDSDRNVNDDGEIDIAQLKRCLQDETTEKVNREKTVEEEREPMDKTKGKVCDDKKEPSPTTTNTRMDRRKENLNFKSGISEDEEYEFKANTKTNEVTSAVVIETNEAKVELFSDEVNIKQTVAVAEEKQFVDAKVRETPTGNGNKQVSIPLNKKVNENASNPGERFEGGLDKSKDSSRSGNEIKAFPKDSWFPKSSRKLDKTRPDRPLKIQRKHSLEPGYNCKGFKSCRESEVSQTKIEFTYSQWKSIYMKSKSCPPRLTFGSDNSAQLEIPILDIPVEDIPLPPGDPPPENCFRLEDYLKKRKMSLESSSESPSSGVNAKDSKNSRIKASKDLTAAGDQRKSDIDGFGKCPEKRRLASVPRADKWEQISPLVPENIRNFRGGHDPKPVTRVEGVKAKEEITGVSDIDQTVSTETGTEKTERFEVNSAKEINFQKQLNPTVDSGITSSGTDDKLTSKISFQEGHQVENNDSNRINSEEISQSSPGIPLMDEDNKPPVELVTRSNASDKGDGRHEAELEIQESDPPKDKSDMIDHSVMTDVSSSQLFPEARDGFKEPDLQSDSEEPASIGPMPGDNANPEETETDDKVELADGESTEDTCFENDSFMKDGFYECEDIPTFEDLSNVNDIEVEKVSDDDKFRDMMQNCLDNAKKFLNVSNLKLFSCSVEDLLDLDCELTNSTVDAREMEKPTDHLGRDVLLTPCHELEAGKLELEGNCPSSDSSSESAPSFGTENSNNLCPEILPVDNWPYLEEEVPSSPVRSYAEEGRLIPYEERYANSLVTVSETELFEKPDAQNGVRGDIRKAVAKKCLSRTKVLNGNYRRRSLMESDETAYSSASKISDKRRKTTDGMSGNTLRHRQISIKENVGDFRAEIIKLKNGLSKYRHLKCRVSLERIENYKKSRTGTHSCNRIECKTRCNCSQGGNPSKNGIYENGTHWKCNENQSGGRRSRRFDSLNEAFLFGEDSRDNYKSPMWQPRVMLFRISKKQLRNIHERRLSNKCERTNGHRVHGEDSLKGEKSYENVKCVRTNQTGSGSPLKRKKFSWNSDEDQTEQKYPPESRYRTQRKEGCEAIEETELSPCKPHIFEPLGNETAETLRYKESSLLEKIASELKMSDDGEKPETNFFMGPSAKRKKPRFRNLHSDRGKSKSNHSAKEIHATAQKALYIKPTNAENVPRQIFKNSDERGEQVLEHQKVSTKQEVSRTENGHVDSIKIKNEKLINSQVLGAAQKRKQSNRENGDQYHCHSKAGGGCGGHSVATDGTHRESNESLGKSGKFGKTFEVSNESQAGDDASRNRKHEESRSHKFHKDSKKIPSERSRGKHHEDKERPRRKSESREHKSDHKHKENLSGDNSRRRESHNLKKCDPKENPNWKTAQLTNSNPSEEEVSSSRREKDSGESWTCEVCGFSDADDRIAHIKDHPFHCQSCHLAFKTEARFVDHLTDKHKDIRNQHHCLLCELSFDTEKQYQMHLDTREHKHLETVEKNTINTLFTLLTGRPCPVLGLVEMKPEWLPNQAGTVHFYHQATPLSLALQYLKMHHEMSSYSKESTSHP